VNLNREYIKSLIAGIFPNSEIISIKLLNCESSANFIVDIYDDNNGNRAVFIKRPKVNCDMGYVREMVLTFLKEKKEEMISAPIIYQLSHEKRVFVIEHIYGFNLHQIFTSINLRRQNDLNRIIDLSAIALAEFHKVFKKNEYTEKFCDPDRLVKINDVKFINGCINKCNLNFKTQLFFDFKFENILFDPEASKLYLIDFPDKSRIYTPHYDIAEFRRDIYILSQHPKFMLLNKWNDPAMIYNRFFSTYYNCLGIIPNEYDESIIKYFSNNMIEYMLKFYLNHKLENFNLIKYAFIKRAYRMNTLFHTKYL
jgi:hypothetical protein